MTSDVLPPTRPHLFSFLDMPSLNQCSFLYSIRKSAPQMHLLMQCWLLNTPKEPDLRWPCTYALPSYLSSLPRRALLSASLPWSITPCAASSAVPLDAPTHKGPARVLRQSDNTAAELRRSPCHLCSGSDIKLLLIETLQCRNDWHEFRLWTV